jgi:fused signal recognition particle receptor
MSSVRIEETVVVLGRLSKSMEEYCRANAFEASLLIVILTFGFLLSSLIFIRRINRLKAALRASNNELLVIKESQELAHVETTAEEPVPVDSTRDIVVSEPSMPLPAEHELLVSSHDSLPDEDSSTANPEAPPRPRGSRVRRGLEKTRLGFLSRLGLLFEGKSVIDSSMLDDLEEALILSDVGHRCASDLVEEVSEGFVNGEPIDRSALEDKLEGCISNRLLAPAPDSSLYEPQGACKVFLVVGVNGVGKTTTVAKLAAKYVAQGKRVMAVAADTFRAAAVQQLEEWSNRVGFEVVKGAEGAKPGAVVFDGMKRAKDEGFEVVLIDTAGRLHTKSNLMQELQGIRNSITRHIPEAPHETLLVVDGVSGQNALSQAREFNSATELTGLVVTKLDGTPRGGIIVAISDEVSIPVYYIGVGEAAEDLVQFNPAEFSRSLFGATEGSDDRAVRNAVNL